jgi:transcriptional regulator with XRE-family HTH domain
MSESHLNQKELARRWGISPRTLERWRRTGQGPRYMKLGWLVFYRKVDVAAYEEQQLSAPAGSDPAGQR